mmetsp:Transcript_7136/g.18051  ORF Transcript_7136/g.18051 Transcript_7136/m.18051 type:complete len:393 (+) Transcript_7136:1227-2405(+)
MWCTSFRAESRLSVKKTDRPDIRSSRNDHSQVSRCGAPAWPCDRTGVRWKCRSRRTTLACMMRRSCWLNSNTASRERAMSSTMLEAVMLAMRSATRDEANASTVPSLPTPCAMPCCRRYCATAPSTRASRSALGTVSSPTICTRSCSDSDCRMQFSREGPCVAAGSAGGGNMRAMGSNRRPYSDSSVARACVNWSSLRLTRRSSSAREFMKEATAGCPADGACPPCSSSPNSSSSTSSRTTSFDGAWAAAAAATGPVARFLAGAAGLLRDCCTDGGFVAVGAPLVGAMAGGPPGAPAMRDAEFRVYWMAWEMNGARLGMGTAPAPPGIPPGIPPGAAAGAPAGAAPAFGLLRAAGGAGALPPGAAAACCLRGISEMWMETELFTGVGRRGAD